MSAPTSLSDSVNSFQFEFHNEIENKKEEVGKRACSVASKVHNEILQHSSCVGMQGLQQAQRVVKADISWGKLLHKCQFSDIYNITTYKLPAPRKYCLKQVRSEPNAQTYLRGASELSREVLYLSSFSHPNIVSLKAVSNEGPVGYRSGEGCFLIMEKIEDTLEQRLNEWQKTKAPPMQIRLSICSGISSALSFLHNRNIIYRDLRPSNLAFTIDGKLKIIEMGCARELHPSQLVDGINYELSPRGTIPFIAPEVITKRPYNLSADVYSISVLIWHVLTLRKTEFKSKESYIHSCLVQMSRPPLDPQWTHTLRFLLQGGWADFPGNRPTMKQFHYWLQYEVDTMRARTNKIASIQSNCNNTIPNSPRLDEPPMSPRISPRPPRNDSKRGLQRKHASKSTAPPKKNNLHSKSPLHASDSRLSFDSLARPSPLYVSSPILSIEGISSINAQTRGRTMSRSPSPAPKSILRCQSPLRREQFIRKEQMQRQSSRKDLVRSESPRKAVRWEDEKKQNGQPYRRMASAA